MYFCCLLTILKSEIRESNLPPESFIPKGRRDILRKSYKILKLTGVVAADESMWISGHTFTASRHLWEASSSVEFFRSWREQPQWGILDSCFKDFWMYGRPEDADEFTKVLLMT